ncbi:MAG: DUF3604 domain-containing protein [Verrucomicrobia bacterium]|nr:DUF3604 domain-containing protein [Verrucomicrobiota bacterium]
MRSIVFLLLTSAVAISAPGKKQKVDGSEFVYDFAEKNLKAKVLDNEFFYDADIATTTEGNWLTWLEFQPGKGDVIWVGLRKNDDWAQKEQITPKHDAFAKPTLTIDAKGKLWLTYEAGPGGKWDIFARPYDGKKFGAAQKISTAEGADINHSVVADSNEGLWIVWQSDQDGQFEILGRKLSGSKLSEIHTISSSPRGDWQPSAAMTAKGELIVAWDSYDGESYNVVLRSFRDGKWSNISTIAGTAAFEGRAKVIADKTSRLFISWEEDGANWGKHYTARIPGDKGSTKMGDSVGPVHRFRKLHLAEVDSKTLKPIKRYALPQPSLQQAAERSNAPSDVKFLGAFYERAQLVLDGLNRPWIVYRHYYTPWMGLHPHHHVEDDFAIYARCLMKDGWSDLVKFDVGQGDGMQRLSLSATKDGFNAIWTTGRTDRQKHPKRPRGIAYSEVTLDGAAKASVSIQPTAFQTESSKASIATPRNSRPVTKANGKQMQLFFGDLHRHTDMSLCYTPSDGTIEDAYRYAIDAAPLDFLGITDHTHDLQMGEPLSQLWWRALKETDRHKLQDSFITFYSYERSRGDTDHNVISLRPDKMRPHTYPLPDFWQELDSDTFTIPHEPFNPALWKHKDNAHRPLLEIYQGYRHMSGEDAANEGLSKGHEFGFIASSDHLSTSASFAGVWAEQSTRESIFRSMQARRTFGATAPIILKVTSGKYWMGERFETKKMSPIKIELRPTAGVRSIELFTNGKLESSVIDLISSPGKPLIYNWQPKPASGPNFYYVRITQTDGNRAWSSPIWVDLK